MSVLLLFVCGITFLPVPCYGRDELQRFLEQREFDGDIEQLALQLEDLRSNPLLLNTIDPQELRVLPWLNSADIQAIALYRRDKGRIRSKSQLDDVIGKEKASATLPFITFSDRDVPREAGSAWIPSGTLYSRVSWDTTVRDGIKDGRYAGENYKLYNRLQAGIPHFKVSLVQDKDIGESDVTDFLSLSVNGYDICAIKSVVLGNYELNFAQGLLMGQGRFFSKGSDPANSVRLASKRLSGYASSSEYGFMQGLAASVVLDPFELTAFYSDNLVDARIATDKKTGFRSITSLDDAGYHRTNTEILRKDNVHEKVSGANLLVHFNNGLLKGSAGGTLLHYAYDEERELPDGSTTSSANLFGFETAFSLGDLSVFAEAAFSEKPEDFSWIAGAEYEIVKGLDLQTAIRNYGVNYFSPFAGAFAERGDDASNEEGYYIGLEAKFSKKLTAAAYVDWFRFPSLSGDNDYPFASEGYDTRFYLTWKQTPSVVWNLQLQHKEKEEARKQCPLVNGAWIPCKDSKTVYTALPVVSDRARLYCDVMPSRKFHLRTLGEVKRVVNDFRAGDERLFGYLLYQQVHYESGPLSFKGRVTLFNTDDFDSAIYVYEDDLPLVFNTAMCSGRGKSLMLLASWDVMQSMTLGAKYEVTWYTDRDLYSSGADQRDTSAPGTVTLGCSLRF
ncbi:MAG: helix-hairpin-helix domain-containing protein [Chlorobiaceae bacterium]|nr:helix-hairpin-helix domain-containing protein [Chlorobiaceae bacterium]